VTRRVAVVDIGTNTLKFSVTAIGDDGSETIIDAHADTVRLGAGIKTSGVIEPDRIARALASLTAYEHVARGLGAEACIGVATAALRLARNGDEMLNRISCSTGWKVRVVSGADEARLAFNGLAAQLPETGNALLADVGGGSTELIAVTDRSLVLSESFDIGSGTLADRLFRADPPGIEVVQAAVHYATSTLDRSLVIQSSIGSALYLSGGNGQFLSDFAEWDDVAIPFVPSGFDDLVKSISARESIAIARYLGIAQERARMLPAGAAIARAIICLSNPESVAAVPSGIRGGLLAEWLATHPK
jgi:exopolyphosphatase/guanosine-5'-triphosphate,3'-diphosphate pyrophosphatase